MVGLSRQCCGLAVAEAAVDWMVGLVWCWVGVALRLMQASLGRTVKVGVNLKSSGVCVAEQMSVRASVGEVANG